MLDVKHYHGVVEELDRSDIELSAAAKEASEV